MNDTNKERAEFEAHYFAENGNRLYCESQWRGWQARAAKAPAAPTGWYALAADGMATLCVDRDDAEKEAANSEKKWPHLGPYRAVQLYTAPPAPTEQWMPIETAPKDGSRLILTDGAKVFRGGFARLESKEHPDAYWMNFDDCDVCHPTHWQPEPALPAPPQGAAKGANDAASS